jgi:hypothetical protein
MARAGTRYPRPREREHGNHATYRTDRNSIASRALGSALFEPGDLWASRRRGRCREGAAGLKAPRLASYRSPVLARVARACRLLLCATLRLSVALRKIGCAALSHRTCGDV